MENNEEKLVSGPGPKPLGRWTIKPEKCNTCCECVDACTKGLLYFDEKNKLIRIKYEGLCTHCGLCASACAYGAIVLT